MVTLSKAIMEVNDSHEDLGHVIRDLTKDNKYTPAVQLIQQIQPILRNLPPLVHHSGV
jgi:hypothetical protein